MITVHIKRITLGRRAPQPGALAICGERAALRYIFAEADEPTDRVAARFAKKDHEGELCPDCLGEQPSPLAPGRVELKLSMPAEGALRIKALWEARDPEFLKSMADAGFPIEDLKVSQTD